MADPRSSSAKMIAERLRAGALPPSSAHPDADLLTAFAERSLSERERTRILDHLAHCAVCRDVVYLAQPELEAPSLATTGSPAPIRWFAWRRLQWAALAASLSLVVALAVMLKQNPERSVLTDRAENEPASPQTVAQNQAKNDGTVATYAYDSSSAAVNEKAERREAASDSPEKQGRLQAEAKAATGPGQKSVHGAANFESEGYFAKLSPGVAKSATDDLRKTANPYDKEEASKKDVFAFRGDEKDAFINSATVNGNAGAQTAGGSRFGFGQPGVNSGPSANMNAQNSIQNNANNNLYRDRSADSSGAVVSMSQPAPAPPPAAASTTTADLKVQPKESAEQGATMGGPVLARSAPTRAVVPAEDVRNKKKLETIPAHATPPGTEETVAVAGKVQDLDAARAAASGITSTDSIQEFNVTKPASLSSGVASASAITGWRVHHGMLLGKLYGIWHNLILRKLQNAGENSVTEISSALESIVGSEANSRSAGTRDKVSSVSEKITMAPQHFTSVAALGADVWALEVIGQGQSQLVVHHSRDAGITWQPSILTTQATLKPNAEAGIKFKDAQQGEITLPTGEKWQTTDGGAHWAKSEVRSPK